MITKEEFIQQNKFGTISKQNGDGSTTILTQEEYDEFVENSYGIWSDNPQSLIGTSSRNCRDFALWAMVDVDATHVHDSLVQACSTKKHGEKTYACIPIHSLSAGLFFPFKKPANDQDVFMQRFWDLITSENYSSVKTHRVIVSAPPHFAIVFNEMSEEGSKDPFLETISHPHVAARTAHELIRIVYEWSWAYDVLGNREYVAQLCKMCIEHLNMPDNVFKFIKTMPDMGVVKYLKGKPDAALPAEIDPPVDQAFVKWWDDLELNGQS
jgi:hypothetical protein